MTWGFLMMCMLHASCELPSLWGILSQTWTPQCHSFVGMSFSLCLQRCFLHTLQVSTEITSSERSSLTTLVSPVTMLCYGKHTQDFIFLWLCMFLLHPNQNIRGFTKFMENSRSVLIIPPMKFLQSCVDFLWTGLLNFPLHLQECKPSYMPSLTIKWANEWKTGCVTYQDNFSDIKF